ncbi:response regulator [Candidatus Magnetaquicoccus inordinatus]|uniref:ATP-binding response regulator n=1 Tax=Candidatus Magnetaquicoccus inordinatus TaxID=2496818 RepID=UPI00102BF06C|nr:response regulator [Candidatus Magnetaquicoccus inordinatus]
MNKDKILVVDDEQLIFDSIDDTLGDDYQLFHAQNGEIGLQMLQEVKPILVILDIRMPVMDGFQFLQRVGVATDDPYAIIVLSGHAAGADIGACYDMGVTAFLRKPFNVFELKGLAKQCIAAKKQYQALLQERQTLRAFFDYSMDMIAVVDREFKFVDINPAAELLFGYDKTLLQGMPLRELLPIAEQYSSVEQFLTTANAFPDQLTIQPKGMEAVQVALRLAILHDAAGNPVEGELNENQQLVWHTASLLLTRPS